MCFRNLPDEVFREYIKKKGRYYMKSHLQKNFIVTGVLAALFVLFTVLVMKVDVQAVGPENSEVGFASLNQYIHELTGESEFCYQVSKYAGLLPIFTALCFVALGAKQLVQGKSLFKVDIAIILMGFYYVLVGIFYVLFEKVVINYRPVIRDAEEGLEASYPSSHTILAVCIMSAAMIYAAKRIRDDRMKNAVIAVSALVMLVIVVTRLLSGVHWFTDIIGGLVLSSALVMLYYSMLKYALSLKHRTKKSS